MEESWEIHPWKIHGKCYGKHMQKQWKTQWKIHGKSMGNPWKIKTEKKEMFPWFSMDIKKIEKSNLWKPPKMGSKTGIRFDTKWHHN